MAGELGFRLLTFSMTESVRNPATVMPMRLLQTTFDMEIFCKRAKIQIGDREGRVDLLYNMSIGGESRSARMRITWN